MGRVLFVFFFTKKRKGVVSARPTSYAIPTSPFQDASTLRKSGMMFRRTLGCSHVLLAFIVSARSGIGLRAYSIILDAAIAVFVHTESSRRADKSTCRRCELPHAEGTRLSMCVLEMATSLRDDRNLGSIEYDCSVAHRTWRLRDGRSCISWTRQCSPTD